MVKLVNRAKMTTATTGTGTITVGSAVDGFQTFAAAGVSNGETIRYTIEDGTNWEVGSGTYNAGTLTRSVDESSNAGSAISLSGSAIVFVTASDADIQQPPSEGAFVDGDKTKLDGIEATADVTDAGNVNPLVDAHLNTGTASSGEVLSWNGTDYDWVTSGGAFSVIGTRNLAAIATLPDLTTGTDNFVAGNLAGDNLTTGVNNVIFGNLAGGARTTGKDGIIIGFEAGRFTNSDGVVLIGDEVGRTAGFKTINIGAFAGRNNTGTRTIAIGADALLGVAGSSTGSENVAIGTEAGKDVTTGANNFLGGYLAGTNLTTGFNNVALGNSALDAATTGSNNVALGDNAMGSATTGRSNVAIGPEAMGSGVATDAFGYNIAIGRQAGRQITTGTNNIAIGKNALDSTQTGGSNIAIGEDAMGSALTNTLGWNIAIGDQAGNDLTSATGSLLLGRRAGWNITTGTNNVMLGRDTSSVTTTGSNNIVIGYSAAASSATVSNEITLGNSSITRFRIPAAGIDNTSAALSGTTPSVDVGARDTYTLTTSGNTTFTFTGAPSSGQVGTFSLIITAGGTHTLTWPASVDWAGGTAPDAPASGEKDIYTFMTVDGGTTWYGFLAGDAMA